MNDKKTLKKLLNNIEEMVRSEDIYSMEQLKLSYENIDRSKPRNIGKKFEELEMFEDELNFVEQLLKKDAEKSKETHEKPEDCSKKLIDKARENLAAKYFQKPWINLNVVRFADEKSLKNYIQEIIFIEEKYFDPLGPIDNIFSMKNKGSELRESKRYAVDVLIKKEHDRIEILRTIGGDGDADGTITQIYKNILGYIPEKRDKKKYKKERE